MATATVAEATRDGDVELDTVAASSPLSVEDFIANLTGHVERLRRAALLEQGSHIDGVAAAKHKTASLILAKAQQLVARRR